MAVAIRTAGLTLSAVLLIGGAAQAQGAYVSFAPADVERTRVFWVENARSGGRDCLETINEAMRILYNDRGMRLGSTVDRTMRALQSRGRAHGPTVIRFLDANGRRTTGVREPVELSESVWDTMVRFADGKPDGWYLFGFSPLDGYHSIILSLDLTDRADPKVYWSDQWSSNRGFRLYESAEDLDGRIEELTNQWWNSVMNSRGVAFKSDAKLYPLIPRQDERAPETEMQATVTDRAPSRGIPLHEAAGGDTYLRDGEGARRMAEPGTTFLVTGRNGQWVRVQLPDGEEGWLHTLFLRLLEVPIQVATNRADGAADRLGRAFGD